MKSIDKYWASPFEPIIIADAGCENYLRVADTCGYDVRFVQRWSDGRRDQVYLKMMADTMVDPPAETILYMDSDCLFTKHSETSDFCVDGRPMIKMRSYHDACSIWPGCRATYQGYRHAVWECLDIGTEWEYMQVQPFLFFKDTVKKVREEIETRNGQSLKEVMRRYPSNTFSEFNFFGAYAHSLEDDRYDFLSPDKWGEPRMRQFQSRPETPDSERVEIERILK